MSRKPVFRKSTYSSDSWNCVEVALSPGTVAVRDSKNVTGPTLQYHAAAWTAFVEALCDGEFAR
jgi:hypothetical protein